MTIADRFSSFAPQIQGLTRMIIGGLFMTYGAMKLFGAFGGMPPGVAWWIQYLGGSIEFFGGLLMVIGLFTRFTAFIASGMMAVAYFYGHIYLSPVKTFWPNVNQGDKAVLFCWVFLLYAAIGPGAWAVDNVLRRARR